MKKKELESYLTSWVESWTGNEPKKLLKYYGSKVVFQDPLNPNGIKGKKELEPYLTKLLAKNPKWKWEIKEIIPTKNGCTVKTEATIPSKKKTVIIPCVDIIEIKGSKITRNEVYFDRSKLK